jgi:uncharacterized protein (TIGR03437 family)
LLPGQYYGSVTISAPNAANSPQTLLVLLNVAGADASNTNIDLSTSGLIFTVPSDAITSQQQQINLFNASSSAVNYSATLATSNGNSWLSLSPASGQLPPGNTSVAVTVNPSALSAGVQTGTVTFGFDNGSTGSIQVAAISTSIPNNPALAQNATGARLVSASHACANGIAGYLVPVFRQPSAQSAPKAGLPQTIQLQIVDDCGNLLTSDHGGMAQVSFSDSDPSIDLHDAGKGLWEGTWTPMESAAQVKLSVVASELSPALHSIRAGVALTVSPAPADAPAGIFTVMNAASTARAIPQTVAPGSYVAIYGAGFTTNSAAVATTVPLPTILNDTQLLLGNQPLPLLYAGAGQVNALVPQNLNTDTTWQLTVRRGSTSSVPVPITIARYQPGIYTLNFSGGGQGIAEIVGTSLIAGQVGNGFKPAQRGSDYLSIFATGLGSVIGANGEAPPPDGAAAPLTSVYKSVGAVSATIGGVDVPVLFSGLTPSLVGLYQVNVQITDAVPTGEAVPVVITVTDPVTGKSIQSNTVTIAVQ